MEPRWGWQERESPVGTTQPTSRRSAHSLHFPALGPFKERVHLGTSASKRWQGGGAEGYRGKRAIFLLHSCPKGPEGGQPSAQLRESLEEKIRFYAHRQVV